MNTSLVVAQATLSGSGTGTRPLRTIKVTKPQGDQAVTVQLGYEQNYKIDLSAIANEKITLVHIGEKLIILFDNKSTVTVEPFFDSMNSPLSNVTVEATGRDFTSSEFASAFPITTDQSVLTAAGVSAAQGSPASGADFHGPAVDPLDVPNPLPLLGQEELPNFVVAPQILTNGPAAPATPPTETPAVIAGAVDEGGLFLTTIGTVGNDLGVATSFTGNAGNGQSLMNTVTWGSAGPGAVPFQFTVGTGDSLASLGMSTHDASGTIIQVDTASVTGNTLTAFAGGLGGIAVFTLTLNADGSWTFQDIAPINHTPFGVDNGKNDDAFDLSSIVKVVGGDASSFTLAPDTLVVTITDDIPVLRSPVEDGEFTFVPLVTGAVDEGGLASDAIGTIGNNPGAQTTATGDPGSLFSLVDFGADGPNATTPFQFAVGNGADLTGLGMFTHSALGALVQVDTASISGDTLTAYAGGTSGVAVFTLSIHSDGSWEFTDLAPINHAPSANNGSNSNTFDLSSLLEAVDFDGDSVALSNDFKITIVDDVPVAHDDADSVSVDGAHTADGNVITGTGGSDANGTDGVADALGADGLGSIAWLNAAGGVIAGLHGTLTVDANGNYSYALNAADPAVQALPVSGTLDDTFSYTITDADGDTSTATLTVEISGGDHGVTITGIGAESGDQTVNEANLSNGSSPNDPALTQSGTFNISAPDGFGDLTIGGVTIVAGGVVSLPGSPITTAYGQLTITDVNLATGVVSYSYTLTTDALVSGTATFDNVSVHLTDTDTSFADSTLTIKVVDDAPVAHADTDSVQSSGTATGNVVTGVDVVVSPDANGTDGVADTQGADGATVSGVVAGNSVGTPVVDNTGVGSAIATGLGTLTLNADGSYSYVAKANVSGTDTFTYTIKDGDGDTSTTTLTISVNNGQPQPAAATGTVDEAGLATGSSPSVPATQTSGTLNLGDPDSPHVTNISGVTSSAVGGSAVTVNGLYGTLQIDQNGNYTYTLTSNDPHHTTAGTGIDGQTDAFTYTVTDSFGNTGVNTITISIKDDVPTAGFTLGTTAVTIDETTGVQGLPANDHSGAWPLATPAGAGALMGWAQSAGSVIGSDTSKGGADGKASVSYALTTAVGGAFSGVDSGLSTTATGNKIWLFTEGNLVVGREGSGAGGVTANAGGAVAFAIGLDGSNNLDVAQYEAIKHANASDPNDSASLTSGLLHVTQTVTDGDGDKATSTNATGLSLTFTDDGPTAPTVSASAVNVAIDETPGVQGGAANDIAGSTVVTFNGASTTIANLFATAPTKGLDTDVSSAALDNGALSYATSGASIVTLTGGSFGADGPATSGAVSTTYSLFVNNQSSGLTLTDGTPITLALDGNGRVIGTVGNDVANPSLTGTSAFAIMVDPSNGQIYMAQYLSLHHPDSTNPNDPVSLTPFSVLVSATYKDGDGDTATSAFGDISTHINFLDDGPSANAVSKNLSPAGHDTNIMLILDTSGSMSDPSGLPGLSRLAVMKTAVTDLLEQYGDIGDVRVQIVQFSSDGSQVGSNWMTIAQAEAAVNALTSGGNTDYDAAVATAESIYGNAGKIATAGVQNVSYFMSDGVPNESNGTGTNGIVGAEITAWQTFLSNNSINGFSLGMGAGATQSALDPLAYNGVTHVDTNAVIVTDLSQLSSTLVGTVSSTGGNILTDGILPGTFGADGGFVKSITADGTTYTYNPAAGGSIAVSGGANHGSFDTATNTETVTLASGGVLTMVMDNGTFGYTAPAVVTTSFTDNVQFLLTDNDGDTAGNTLTINVTAPDHAPSITSNGGGATAAISINENTTAVTTVTSTDTDGPAAIYSIVGGADAAKFSVNASTGVLSFISAPNFEAPTDAGANNVYDVTVQVSDGTLIDTQAISVTVTNVNEFAPVITSNGGGASAAVNVAENTTAVTTVVATDADLTTPSYSIVGGADAAQFSINVSNGVLTFLAPHNFEAPTDSGANNVYDVTVRASDGTNFDDQAIAVTVTNVNEAPTAVNDILISNFGGNTYSVPEWAFLSNDSDPEGNAIDVNATPSESGLSSIGHTAGAGTNGTIDINDNGNGGNATFTYNDTDGSLVSNDATVSVNNQNGGNITGTASNEILFGDGNGNTFNGAGGNDIIFAGAGNDTVIGGTGSDTLIGGAGADHFRYTSTSDGGTIANQAGADHVLDFNTAEGDVIEISKAAFSASGLPNAGSALNGTTFSASADDTFASGNERFHFNTTTHTLLYDSNGSTGGGTQVALAVLENGATVDAAHILMVA